MAWFVGVDVGSFRCKAALMDEGGLVGERVAPSGTDYGRSARDVVEGLLSENGVGPEEVQAVVATGMGAGRVGIADAIADEVLCTARGIFAVEPSVRTVIDVGAQSTRVVWIDGSGRVTNFAANEKCATGSGRFLQVVANVLRVAIEEVGPLSLRSRHPVTFTTGCAVFGESEAITRVSEGVAKEDILAGVHRSLAEKILSLVRAHGLQPTCAVCGGGALDVGLLRHLEAVLGVVPVVPEASQVIGAVGAAVHAMRLPRVGEAAAGGARVPAPGASAPARGAGRAPGRPAGHAGPARGRVGPARGKTIAEGGTG